MSPPTRRLLQLRERSQDAVHRPKDSHLPLVRRPNRARRQPLPRQLRGLLERGASLEIEGRAEQRAVQ